MDAVSTAVALYRLQPNRWRAMQRRGMTADYSWDKAAEQYATVLLRTSKKTAAAR
jgi:glycogen synthase